MNDPTPAAPALCVRDLWAGYGRAPVLRGVSFDVPAASIVAVLGRNGAGRSTLAKAIMGLLPTQGQIVGAGQDLSGWRAYRRARAGLAYIPETRGIFADLSVAENLALGRLAARHAEWATQEAVLARFPLLRPRLTAQAGRLSGGEQQLLALGRAMMAAPRVLIADAPTEGMAPRMVDAVAHCLSDLRRAGVAVLLIEQNLALVEALADRMLLLQNGGIVLHAEAGNYAAVRETIRAALTPGGV